MTRRLVLVGASGLFGERLARRLMMSPDTVLVLAARRTEPLERLKERLIADGASVVLEISAFDRRRPESLADLHPWAVVDTSGPFQDAGYGLAHAALKAGAHYVDIADARGFVAGFAAALDGEARRAGRLAATGASSTPALTVAAVQALAGDWRRIDRIEAAISPGSSAFSGASVIRAALSWAGQPVELFVGGAWRKRRGGDLLRRLDMPGLGPRWVLLADTPDLDLLPRRFSVQREALFLAGAELGLETAAMWLLSLLVRLGFMRSLTPLAAVLSWLAHRLSGLGCDRGGMCVIVEGVDHNGAVARAQWSLWAAPGIGPYVPVLPAAAILRGLADGRCAEPGALEAAGLASLGAILDEAVGLNIRTRIERGAPDDRSFGRRLMGDGFDRMPLAVRIVHAGIGRSRFRGHARARGGAGLAALARRVAGMPGPGEHPNLEVEIAADANGETWKRRFGGSVFRSRLRDVGTVIGRFEERLGPLAFAFRAEPDASGFRWRFEGWRLGPLPLPLWLAPRIHARSFARGDAYRFSVAVAHPWVGLMLAYAGELGIVDPEA